MKKIIIKKKEDKKDTCARTLLSCVHVCTHSTVYCKNVIDFFVLWILASVIKCYFLN